MPVDAADAIQLIETETLDMKQLDDSKQQIDRENNGGTRPQHPLCKLPMGRQQTMANRDDQHAEQLSREKEDSLSGVGGPEQRTAAIEDKHQIDEENGAMGNKPTFPAYQSPKENDSQTRCCGNEPGYHKLVVQVG